MRRLIIIFFILILVQTVHSQLPTKIGEVRADSQSTLMGYRIMPLGDQNNDGFDDFLTWSYESKAFLFYGGPSLDTFTTPGLTIERVQNRFNNIGDLNNDGYDDIVIGGRADVNWQLNVFYGGPTVDTIRDLWFGNDTVHGDGYNAITDDINRNGNNEMWTWNNDVGITHYSVAMYELGTDSDSIVDLTLTPPNLNYLIDYAGFGESIISGDFNGDNFDDLAISIRYSESDSLKGQIFIYYSNPLFDSIPDLIITRPGAYERGNNNFGRILEFLGDVNNDGYDDFLAGSGFSFYDSLNFIYFGGPNIDTIPDLIIYENLIRARLAGDLNGDGANDLITSFPLPSSGAGHVMIFYGGDLLDNNPDITITNGDIPQYQEQFGNDCTGIGDANGDGINDFAFSAVQGQLKGIIYIYSGTGPSTDIDYNFEPNLPDNFTLSQNYPNPFNPTTIIEFQIPNRQFITLSIYNTLGQRVRTLINKELPVGSYSLAWDGKNDGHVDVASGVYLYKLEAGEVVLSKKMVLMR